MTRWSFRHSSKQNFEEPQEPDALGKLQLFSSIRLRPVRGNGLGVGFGGSTPVEG